MNLCSLHTLKMVAFCLRCSSGFDRNRQDWVDLGCLEEVLIIPQFSKLHKVQLAITCVCLLNSSLMFVFTEKGSPVSPGDRCCKHHISPPHTYDHSCYDDHDAAENLQHDLHPCQQNVIHCHQPLYTQQHQQQKSIHSTASDQQTCRRYATVNKMCVFYQSETCCCCWDPHPVCWVKSDSQRVKWSAISQPSVSSQLSVYSAMLNTAQCPQLLNVNANVCESLQSAQNMEEAACILSVGAIVFKLKCPQTKHLFQLSFCIFRSYKLT